MVIRATKDIPKKAEIPQAYKHHGSDHAAFQKSLQRKRGLTCQCIVCAAEIKTPAQDRQRRAELHADVRAVLIANKISDAYMPSVASVDRVEQLYKELETFYGKHYAPMGCA